MLPSKVVLCACFLHCGFPSCAVLNFSTSSLLFQMTFVRLLDTLPFIFERLSQSAFKLSGSSVSVLSGCFDFTWLSYLVDLGRSSLLTIKRRWKQCMLALMNLLKGSCSDSTLCTINVIEAIISCGKFCPFLK